MELTKRYVKEQLGFATDADLARYFGIGRWAVGQWGEDEPIPQGRRWELHAREPGLFGPAPNTQAGPRPAGKRKAA